MLKVLLPAILIMAVVFLGFAIKMFFKKNGEFKKACSHSNPASKKIDGCVCSGDDDRNCVNYEKHHVKQE